MKIESNSPPIINKLKPMPSQKAAAGVSETKTLSEIKLNRQSSQQRIINWFSQVGVQSDSSPLKMSTSNERIQRKKEVLEQRKLINLEKILGKAIDFCLDDGKEEELDPDWFFLYCSFLLGKESSLTDQAPLERKMSYPNDRDRGLQPNTIRQLN